MKLLSIIMIAVIASATPSFAAKGEKKAGKHGAVRKVLKAFDHNRDRQIGGAEIEAVKNAYAAFKKMDANSDGNLDDSEITVLNGKGGKAKAGAAAGAKKKRKKDK
jgi:Ca2+-binding EF-hand superfamily protein